MLSSGKNTISGAVNIYGEAPNSAVGAKAIAVPCGEVATAVEENSLGYFHMLYPENIDYYLRIEKEGYLTSLAPQYHIPAGLGGNGPKVTQYQLYALDVATKGNAKVPAPFPDFAADKAHLLLIIRGADSPAPGTQPCVMPLGHFQVAVDGHPEAKVVYWNAKAPNPQQTDSLGDTANATFVSISGLVPASEGELVTLSGDNTNALPGKAGTCKLGPSAVTANDSWATGKIPLVVNTITNVVRYSFTK